MFKLVDKYAGKPEVEWGPLFQRILQSRIHDWHRRASVRERFRVWLGQGGEEGDPVQQLRDERAANPEAVLQSQRGIAELELLIHVLPIRQQQAFLLRTLEGLDVKATARAMGCTEGSVKTHYSRAVHSLRESLSEHKP